MLEENDLGIYITSQSFCNLRKDLYLCYMNLWKNDSNLKNKEEWIFEACSALNMYLSLEKNNEDIEAFFNDFAGQLYFHALNLTNKQPDSAFKHWELLLKFDLKHNKLIEKNIFSGIIEDILYNMTVCLSNKEEKESGSSEFFKKTMKALLYNPLINLETQHHFQEWLNLNWNYEDTSISENNKEKILESVTIDLTQDHVTIDLTQNFEKENQSTNTESTESTETTEETESTEDIENNSNENYFANKKRFPDSMLPLKKRKLEYFENK